LDFQTCRHHKNWRKLFLTCDKLSFHKKKSVLQDMPLVLLLENPNIRSQWEFSQESRAPWNIS
jgi:hypothetical protein